MQGTQTVQRMVDRDLPGPEISYRGSDPRVKGRGRNLLGKPRIVVRAAGRANVHSQGVGPVHGQAHLGQGRFFPLADSSTGHRRQDRRLEQIGPRLRFPIGDLATYHRESRYRRVRPVSHVDGLGRAAMARSRILRVGSSSVQGTLDRQHGPSGCA